MKYPTAYFTTIAAFLLLIACLATGLSLDMKEGTAAIVACGGAFLLGVIGARGIRSVASTGIYLLLGLLIPRTIAGVLPGKIDIFSAYFMAMLVCLSACAIFFGVGRFVRFVVTKFSHKH